MESINSYELALLIHKTEDFETLVPPLYSAIIKCMLLIGKDVWNEFYDYNELYFQDNPLVFFGKDFISNAEKSGTDELVDLIIIKEASAQLRFVLSTRVFYTLELGGSNKSREVDTLKYSVRLYDEQETDYVFYTYNIKKPQTITLKEKKYSLDLDFDEPQQKENKKEVVNVKIPKLKENTWINNSKMSYCVFSNERENCLNLAKEIDFEGLETQIKTSPLMKDEKFKHFVNNSQLKYLVEFIESKKDTIKIQNDDIKKLLIEAKYQKGKTNVNTHINNIKGFEELYNGFETALVAIKGYTEHSFPFLSKVNKKEVPDYYDIIENPMDLGTMAKKVKNMEYKSKDEFTKDLFLIFDNCLTYNYNPVYKIR